MTRVLLCLLMLSVTAHAWSQAIVSEREYRALVREYADTLQAGVTKAQAERWEQRWRELKRVRCADGRVLTPDHQAEIDSMVRAQNLAQPNKPARASAAARERIQARAWLLDERRGRLIDRGDPTAAAKTILANPEYQKQAKKSSESAIAKWLREKWEIFARWLRSLAVDNPQKSPDLTGAATAVRIFLYLVAGLAVVGGLWLLFRQGSGWRWTRRKQATGMANEPDDLTGATLHDPLGAANAAAANGEYRQAIRLVYIACLWRLRDAALLTLERHRTNWEYQSLLRRRDSQVAELLLPATELYERIWYGGERATQQDFTQLIGLFSTLPERPQ